MKTYLFTKVVAVTCIGILAVCATEPKITGMPVSASFHPDSSPSGRVFREVNSYRLSHGAAELQRHAGLDRLAQMHCEYLRQNRGKFGIYGKNVSHYGFEGRALVARERYRMRSVGENVAAAYHPRRSFAPILVKLWSASKSHEYNMRSAWTHTGVGIVVDRDGTVFSTQIFATVNHSQRIMHQRFNLY